MKLRKKWDKSGKATKLGLRALIEAATPLSVNTSKMPTRVINPSPLGMAFLAASSNVAADGTLNSKEYKKLLKKNRGVIQR